MSGRSPLPDPPRWVEATLRALLAPRDRDTITGDLLEEYREVAVPALGTYGAGRWYLRQALSLLTATRVREFVARSLRRDRMVQHPRVASMLWATAAAVTLSGVVLLLMSSHFGPPRLPLGPAFLILALLALSAATAVRSAADIRFWRAGLLWGGLFAAAMVIRMAVDSLVPADVEDFVLARGRSGFSEFDYPRRWLLGVALVVIFLGAGFGGARRTRQVRTGTLTAMVASVIGFLLTVAAAALRSVLVGSGPPSSIDPPLMGVVVVLGLGTVFGAIGAMFGRGLSGLTRKQAAAP
ncbi:MAG: hypothetical protein LAP40_03475 [Acidobacteriia bacterium]|nr:hypothetical protein [Terriglobia bacterium]